MVLINLRVRHRDVTNTPDLCVCEAPRAMSGESAASGECGSLPEAAEGRGGAAPGANTHTPPQPQSEQLSRRSTPPQHWPGASPARTATHTDARRGPPSAATATVTVGVASAATEKAGAGGEGGNHEC